ncbi:MAG: HD domain-containing protein [Oceanospirillaceae bacterium]|nr:HD domain-containing protein [Oceanospirillaceae bacterium]
MLALFEEQLELIIHRLDIDTAHDISHIQRVVKNAKHLALAEDADLNIVVPAAWLHDVVSLAKNDPQRARASTLAADKAVGILQDLAYPERYLPDIHHAIKAHSYSANVKALSIEAQVVQDADRLDALGAVGIARCFMVSGALHRPLYQSDDPFADQRELDDGRYCIDHFYQKLFKLVVQMNTHTAREIARQRCEYMQSFLRQLKSEIE